MSDIPSNAVLAAFISGNSAAAAESAVGLRIEENGFSDAAALRDAALRIIEALESGLDVESEALIPALTRPKAYGASGENFKFTLEDRSGNWIFCDYRAVRDRLYIRAEGDDTLIVSVTGGAFFERAAAFNAGRI